MPIELDYVINFVADMNEAVAFYRKQSQVDVSADLAATSAWP